MPIYDDQTLFSDYQSITATAPSQDVIDLAPIGAGIVRDIGKGKPIPVQIQVTEGFTAAGSATLTIAMQVDDNAAFSSPKTVATTGAIPVADLKVGYRAGLQFIPAGTNERYLRLQYTVATGPMTAGKIFAGVRYSDGPQD